MIDVLAKVAVALSNFQSFIANAYFYARDRFNQWAVAIAFGIIRPKSFLRLYVFVFLVKISSTTHDGFSCSLALCISMMNNEVLWWIHTEILIASFNTSIYDSQSTFMNFINSTICGSVMEHLN